ncbi:MAG: anthranilate phosphoribosyltransferase family protein [Cyanobacteria bacterium J06573_2]
MSNLFRDLLKKIGSGQHTSHNLTRVEAGLATKMMLLGEATPAQIGAFLIAHRIKRPTSEELAGMLDAYNELGPKLKAVSSERPAIVFGVPYDGRTRTAPVVPITALLLACSGQNVIMHGGGRLPTKYGLTLVEIWQELGVDWTKLNLSKTQQILEKIGIGFVYTPEHFPLIKTIWEYRDQIGKRPPLATMELIWCPYAGDVHIVPGFVHPPTEERFQATLSHMGITNFTTVKGLEGSCDLPQDRTAIIGLGNGGENLERLLLAPREYGFSTKNIPLNGTEQLISEIKSVLAAQPSELMETAIWNGGFYLWRCGICENIDKGFAKARETFNSGAALEKLRELQQVINSIQ